MAAKKTPLKPSPIPPVESERVCSVCGLLWALHSKDPSLEDCVRLLKAELEVAKLKKYVRPEIIPYVGEPYKREPEPWKYGHRETISTGINETSFGHTVLQQGMLPEHDKILSNW